MIMVVILIFDENFGVVVLINGMKSFIIVVIYYVLDWYMGKEEKDWLSMMLVGWNRSQLEDKCIFF